MDESRRYYAKLSKSDRKTNTTWFHLYMESKKQQKQTKIKEKQTHNTENKLMEQVGMGKSSGRHRLPVMEWISHGDERYSIGNIVNGI